MVIVANSGKGLQKTKCKKVPVSVGGSGSNAGKQSSSGVKKSNSSNNNDSKIKKPFVRPPPRPQLSIGPTSVGGGRGKVKTTRNNTLPLPSPKSGLLSQNGPRIHAQRKFAQGATTFSSSGGGVVSLQTHYSPAVTPTKDSSKLKKKVMTPISPPLKRPKTEDFLTFLCFRGTSVLPPELEYFNYPQPLDAEDVPVPAKKAKESVSVSTSVGTDTCQNALLPGIGATTTSSSNGSGAPKVPVIGVKSNGSSSSSTVANRIAGKQSSKLLTGKKLGSGTVVGMIKKNQINGVHASGGVIKSQQQDRLPKKNMLKSSIGEKKNGEKVESKTAAAPQISPSASRINEQDAKFAMTALKLKYVEKRLANARPAKSLITMLTKKVKERSMVLTRSRAKTAVGPLKTSPIQRKLKKPIVRPPVAKPLPRNAPSPDIILGVATSPVKPAESRRSTSPSESESDDGSEPEKKKNSSSSSSSSHSSSSSSSESDEPERATRSLRSGKEVVTKAKSDKKSSSSQKKSSLPERRIGTRAAHRATKSPLRELPMWNVAVKKKKILAKYKKASAKAKANNMRSAMLSSKNVASLQSPSGHITRSAVRKSVGVSKGGRPSRKMKENAATKIGLMNKDFSSDDERSSDESDKEDKSESSEDSSTSEEKFLVNKYNASLKRTKPSRKDKDKEEKERSSSSSSTRLRSQQRKEKSSDKKDSSRKDSKSKSSLERKSKEKDESSKKKNEEKPLPRILRSRSSGSVDSSSKSETSSAAERRKLLMMTCGKHTAGAARKSAKIISRGRRGSKQYSSSDEEGDEDDEEEEEEEDDSEIEDGKETDSDHATEDEVDEEEEEEKSNRSVLKRSGTESPMSIPSSRGSRARSKRVTELIEESRGKDRRSPSLKSSRNSSPVDQKSVKSDRSRSSSTSRKSNEKQIISKDDDTEDDEEEIEEDQEEIQEDEDDDVEEADEDNDDDEIVPSPVASVCESEKVEEDEEEEEEEEEEEVEMETGGEETMASTPASPAAVATQELESSTSTYEETEEEEEEEEEEPVETVDIAIQVDMDAEEEEEKRRLAEAEEAKKAEAAKVEALKAEAAAKAKVSKTSEAGTSTDPPAARTSSIELPLSEEQQAELRQAQEEDDEIQEIGQVIKNPQTVKHHCHHHHRQRRNSPSPPIVPIEQPIGPRISQQSAPPPPPQPQPTHSHSHSHHHHPHVPQPESVPLSIPPHLPPLASRTSSLTYTSHHINLGTSSVPFVPYSSRPSTSDFFPPPPLHFGPTHLVNSVHLVGSSTTDFTSDLTSPLSTLSIPVSVPTLPGFPNPLLPPPPPIGLVPGAATMTATSLQTHIRTVATNLDIPLVRPVVGATDTSLSFSMGMGQPPQLGSIPLIGSHSSASLLSRPLGAWHQTSAASHAAAAAAAAAEASRAHYSAFRLATMQPHPPPSTSSSTMMGVNEVIRPPTSTTLPVSIVHPRTVHQQQQQPGKSQSHQTSSSSSSHGGHSSKDSHHHNHHHHHHHHHHSPSSSSSSNAASNYMQGYNPESIIKNLPNVSIVPKFDRSSAKSQIPTSASSTSTSSSSSSSKKHSKDRNEESKKPGKKKKEPATLPAPSSPLTVKKDSNPATYCGISSKSKKKLDSKDGKDSEKSHSHHHHKHNHDGDSERAPSTSKFDAVKLLHMKQERIEGHEQPCSSGGGNKGRNTPPLIRLDQIKQEIIAPSPSAMHPLYQPFSSKSHSPSVVSHRKTPDRPTSSGSANNSTGKSHHHGDETPNKKSSSGSGSSKKSGSSSSSNTTTNSKLLEAPTYHPSEQEFEDPLKYFEKIQPEAEKFGMARIVPPRSFRPECNVNDDMRFTAYNHYIHKMYQRWGPTVQETEAIKEHLKRSDVDISSVPVIGGLEIDFSTLYQTVQSFGGLAEVMEKDKWADVADSLHIPKGTHDRATKLDGVYVKYILPYDMLSESERNNLKKQVHEKWISRTQKLQERTDESSEDETSDEDSMDELDDCVVKGKGTPLSAYYRTARNTVGMIFPNGKEPPINELEDEYWKIVREGKKHLCVYSGSIDCTGVGWGFPAPKASSKHPWNLKVLANNSGSVLRSMGPVMGATVPTLHVSMLFTSYCWFRDPHGLSWVEYLHSGASKIWYSVAATHEKVFRKAMMKLMPLQCKNKKIWLPSDSAMVPPELLMENDVPLVRAVQNPGEFLVVFPKSFTSAICGGYLVSESVCFAPPIWLKSCMEMFKDIRDSKEPPVFPVEKLLLSIVRDNRVSSQVIKMAAPLAERVILEELALRKKLISMGVSQGGKPSKGSAAKEKAKKKRPPTEEEVEQCYFCNYILHMSLVRNERTDFVTCLPHAIQHLSRHKAQIKKCTLLCEETQEELESLLQTSKRRANS